MSNRRTAHEQIQIPELQVIRVGGIGSKDTDPDTQTPIAIPTEMYIVCRNGSNLFGYPLRAKGRIYSFEGITYYKWHSACWWPQPLMAHETLNAFLEQLCENELDCHHVRMEAILTLLNLEC